MGFHSSAACEKDHLFWVPNQLQSFCHVKPLSVSEWGFWHVKPLLVNVWDFIHLWLIKKMICCGSPINCRVFVMSNLCLSVNDTSVISGLRKRNNWLRDACVDSPGNTTTTMTSTLLRRPWLPSLPTNHSTLVTLLSHARLSNFPCSVLWSSVRCNGPS